MWEGKKLEDVCNFSRGLTYKKSDEVDHSNNIVLRANNIDLESAALNFDELKYIRDDIVVPQSKKLTRNSLIICTASGSKKHLGKIAIVDGDYDYAFGGFMGLITPHDSLNPKYLYWHTTSKRYRDFITSLTDGMNINNLKFKDLSQFEIPLPPLPEQQRIVAILDEAFSGIDAAIANTEKNLANARELFESYLNNVFTQKGDGWMERSLGEVCDFQNGFAFKSSDTVEASNVQLIRMGNLYQNILDLNRKPAFYPDDFSSGFERYELHEGDLIMSLTGTVDKEDYGYTVEVPYSEKTLLLNQRIAKFINIDKDILKNYLLYILRSRTFLEQLYASASGTRQANLSTNKMKDLKFYLPSLGRQRKLIDEIRHIDSSVSGLVENGTKKIDALNELKQSILHKAFSGELTAQDAAA